MSLSPAKRILVSSFIAWNLFAIFAWTIPGNPSPLRSRFVIVAQPYLAFTGLWQSWDMFAPHPRSIVVDVQAVIHRASGATQTWKAPGPEQVRFGKYRLERWRKWRDSIRLDSNSIVWPDTARLVARMYSDPSDPPVRVELVRRWADIPPPQAGGFQPLRLATPTGSVIYFVYDVRAEDLSP